MTLVRFNQPQLVNNLATRTWFESFLDSNLGESHACSNYSTVDYSITDSDNHVKLEMLIPGLTKEDLEIVLENDMVSIKTKDENMELKPAMVKPFEKRFKISDKIKANDISALAENGILTILFPKIDEAIPKPARQIDVK